MISTTFKRIEEFEGYAVSPEGLVYSFKKDLLLKPLTNNGGYKSVSLYSNGAKKLLSVHRLVAEAFLDKPDGKNVVNHLNGKRDDNRVENLEWCTQSENKVHGFKTGESGHAQGHYKSKLTREQVLEMRWLYEVGVKVTELADAFDTPVKTVQGIAYGNRWKHIT